MDDARIADEMTLRGIAQRLDSIQADLVTVKQDVAVIKTDVAGLKTDVAGLKTDVAGLKTDVAGLKTDVAGLKTDVAGLKTDVAGLMYEVKTGFDRVDGELNQARIRDEKLQSLIAVGFEAREVLREEMGRRFDAMDRKHDEQISLLQQVVRSR